MSSLTKILAPHRKAIVALIVAEVLRRGLIVDAGALTAVVTAALVWLIPNADVS